MVKRLPKAKVQEIYSLYLQKMNPTEISRIVKVNQTTCSRYVRRFHSAGRVFLPDTLTTLTELVNGKDELIKRSWRIFYQQTDPDVQLKALRMVNDAQDAKADLLMGVTVAERVDHIHETLTKLVKETGRHRTVTLPIVNVGNGVTPPAANTP